MIDEINLETATIPYNFVLIKASPSYDFHEIATPDGTVSIQLTYFNQDKSKYLSISGKVLMLPKERWFFVDKEDGNGEEFNAMVRNSLEFDANCDIKVGNKVFFDYREQVDVEQERRLVRTKEYGLCLLVRMDRIYGVYENDNLRPVNGYVFFLRDQLPDKLELSSGILLVREQNKYAMNTATVLGADAPCRAHLERDYELPIELETGTRILLMKNRGFRISYEVGNEDLRDIEVCQRKDIWGNWTDILEIVKEYETDKKADEFFKDVVVGSEIIYTGIHKEVQL